MKSSLRDGEKNEKILEVELLALDLEKPHANKIKEHGLKITIPGFRKGKAPAMVVEGFIGADIIWAEAAEDLFRKIYEESVDEHKLEPIGQPKVNVGEVKKGMPVTITANIPVKPEIKLGQYKGLPIVKKVYKISDADIKREMQESCDRVAKLVAIEGNEPAALGYVVNIDFVGYLNGEKFQGGEANNYPIELGAGAFIPGFEEQIVGMCVGEERDINVVFPKEYDAPQLAGQEVVFGIRMIAIKKRVSPEINDDFVKEISETANTVQEWEAEVKEKMGKEVQDAAEKRMTDDLLMLAVANCEVEIPFLMTEPQVSKSYEELMYTLQEQGVSVGRYLKHVNKDMRTLRNEMRDQAEKNIACDLMLEAIAKAENLEFTTEEVEEEVRALADQQFQQFDSFYKMILENGQIKYVHDTLRMQKAIKLIVDSAEVTVEEYDAESLAKEAELEEGGVSESAIIGAQDLGTLPQE